MIDITSCKINKQYQDFILSFLQLTYFVLSSQTDFDLEP